MRLPTHQWKRNRRYHAEVLQEEELRHYAGAIPNQKMLIEILADFKDWAERNAVLRRMAPHLRFPLTGPPSVVGIPADTMDLVPTGAWPRADTMDLVATEASCS